MSLTEQPNPITDDIDLASEEGMYIQMVGWKCLHTSFYRPANACGV